MAILMHQPTMLFLLSLFMFCFTSSQSFVGVTYGVFGYILPETRDVSKFLGSTYIQNVRLFNMDAGVIKPMAEANINLVVSTSDNDFIPLLVNNPDMANDWIKDYLMPWADKIDIFTVGNQVMGSGDTLAIQGLVSAMEIMQNAITSANLKIKVSTVTSMAVLTRADPPSNASFRSEFYGPMNKLLRFLKEHNSPFMMTNFPYYAFQSSPTPENLAYCLFQKNAGKVDPQTGLKYWNMFDAKVDAMRNALNGFQHPDIEIMVAETGWPTWGDNNEVGASIDNARIYNSNLVHHLRTMSGTPMTPNKTVSAYIFSLFDENLKTDGRGSDRAFGMVKFDFTWKYSTGLFKYLYKKT